MLLIVSLRLLKDDDALAHGVKPLFNLRRAIIDALKLAAELPEGLLLKLQLALQSEPQGGQVGLDASDHAARPPDNSTASSNQTNHLQQDVEGDGHGDSDRMNVDWGTTASTAPDSEVKATANR